MQNLLIENYLGFEENSLTNNMMKIINSGMDKIRFFKQNKFRKNQQSQ